MENEMDMWHKVIKNKIRELIVELEIEKKEMDKLKKEGEMRNTAESVLFKQINTISNDVKEMQEKMSLSSDRTMELENVLDEEIETLPKEDQSSAAEKRKLPVNLSVLVDAALDAATARSL